MGIFQIFKKNRKFLNNTFLGQLEINFDKLSNLYYLEKEIEINVYKQVTLSFENENCEVSQMQVELFKLVENNSEIIFNNVLDYYKQRYNNDLFLLYTLEYLTIRNCLENQFWELSYLRNGGFEYCHIELIKLEPCDISFSA
jgi:hypothetical protein